MKTNVVMVMIYSRTIVNLNSSKIEPKILYHRNQRREEENNNYRFENFNLHSGGMWVMPEIPLSKDTVAPAGKEIS